MEIEVFTVDAFTNLPFKGNPAAICPLLHVSIDMLGPTILTQRASAAYTCNLYDDRCLPSSFYYY